MAAAYELTLEEALGGKPTEAEQAVIARCAAGKDAGFGLALPGPEGPEIRAGLIRHLLLGGCAAARPHPKGVRIMGARITGRLDFEGCHTRLDLLLASLPFRGRARFPGRGDRGDLPDGQRPAGAGPAARGGGNQFASGYRVPLPRAGRSGRRRRIGGQLAWRWRAAQRVRAQSGNALRVDADVFLRDGFAAQGEVNLAGAEIGGQLSCRRGGSRTGWTFSRPGSPPRFTGGKCKERLGHLT